MQNPFGAAKPREAVLATRVGKKEEDILKEEVLKEKLAVSPSAPLQCPSAGDVQCTKHFRMPITHVQW